MFTNGSISRGVKAQKKMNTEERAYLFCRGRINETTDGFTIAGYENDYNAKTIETAQVIVKDATAGDGTEEIYFFAPNSNKIKMIGTDAPMLINKKYLVIEASANSVDSQGHNHIYIKLSRTKTIGDDGDLYIFELGPEYKKYYIDMSESQISGFRFVSIMTGLLEETTLVAKVKRIYFTNEKNPPILELFNGTDASNYGWQGTTGKMGTDTPATIENGYILFNNSGNASSVKTTKYIELGGYKNVCIAYEATEVATDYAGVGLYDEENNYDTSSLTRPALAVTNQGVARIRLCGGAQLGFANPTAGKFQIELSLVGVIKVKKIWLE